MKAVIKLEPEYCCEECFEVIHNHFEKCPVCFQQHASTNMYCDVTSVKEMACEECNTIFTLISESWYGDQTEVEYMAPNLGK